MTEIKDKKKTKVKVKESKKIKTEINRKTNKTDNKAEKKKKEEYRATGKRKEAIAQVRLIPQKKGLRASKTSVITINHQSMEGYFPILRWQNFVNQPLTVANSLNKYKIVITVKGGGLSGQAGAVRHGISRALLKMDSELRPLLKKSGLLTRSARQKERKKYGQKGARAKFQFTKR